MVLRKCVIAQLQIRIYAITQLCITPYTYTLLRIYANKQFMQFTHYAIYAFTQSHIYVIYATAIT